jgi:hypothetical protein
LQSISDSSCQRILKEKLGYSWKKVSERFLPAATQQNKEHFKEMAIILAAMRLSGINVCFIDEYNVSEQDAHLYNWT